MKHQNRERIKYMSDKCNVCGLCEEDKQLHIHQLHVALSACRSDRDALLKRAEELQAQLCAANVMHDAAQDVLSRHIVPNGFSDHEALNELHGIFDGPLYRAYQAALSSSTCPHKEEAERAKEFLAHLESCVECQDAICAIGDALRRRAEGRGR